MRVTQNTNFNTIRDTIQTSRGRMEELQNKAATLKKLNRPSDNPVDTAKVLEIRTDKVNNEQYFRNAKLAEAFLNNSDHAVDELVEVINRAKEIAINQSSGASSTDETRLGVAEEVAQLFQRAVSAANTRIGDRYLFGGYQTDQPPVNVEGRYQGDAGEMMVEIGKDVFLSMNLPGIYVFNTNPEKSVDYQNLQQKEMLEAKAQGQEPEEVPPPKLNADGSLSHTGQENINVFQELKNLRIGLLTGDLDGVRNTLERFDKLHATLVASRSRIGSRVSGLLGSINAMERHNLTNAELNSVLEDADMAEVLGNIAREETVFKSVLSSSTRLVQPTLIDFLG